MADAATITAVKNALGITGTFMDNTIAIYIDEVTDYMRTAGVSDAIINTSNGVVARGVSDLWNNQSGTSKLSPYFYDRVTQLAIKSKAGGK